MRRRAKKRKKKIPKVLTMMEKIFNLISEAVKKQFCGSITINFFQGGVTNIERRETFKI